MTDLTLLLEGPFLPDAIDVQWLNAPPTFDAHTQSLIDSRWSHHLAAAHSQDKSLFNAHITRLISAEQKNRRLLLTLAPTDYKTFLITTLRDRPLFSNLPPNIAALGNSVLLTHKNQALLGIRSPRTAAYPNRAHLIGGVLDLLNTPSLPASIAGILNHLHTEILEETTLTPADLSSPPTLLAIVRDEFLHQPELIWHYETPLPLTSLAHRLTPDEHSASLLLEKSHIPPQTLPLLTPVAFAAYSRWRAS